MIYTELKTILDRDLSIASSRPESEKYSNLIDTVVDYSTNLLSRSIDQNIGKIDVLVSCYLFMHLFELADAVSVLLKNSIVKPTHLQLRSMYEALNELMFLQQKNTKKRTLCYIYCQNRQNLAISETFHNDNPKFKLIQDFLKSDVLTNNLKLSTFPEIKQQIKEYKKILSDEKYEDIATEYEKRKKARQKLKWYSLFNGPNSILELSDQINTRGVYEITFRYLSKKVHVNEFDSFYKSDDNTVTIERIRKFDNASMVAIYTVSFLLSGIILMTKKYRSPELEHLAIYYKEKIQSEFQSIIN